MKHYYFDIKNNNIDQYIGEVSGTSSAFKLYPSSFGGENVYYKTVDGTITEVICEAFTKKSAEQAVKKFLSNLKIETEVKDNRGEGQ